MIFDIERFVEYNSGHWQELEGILDLIHQSGLGALNYEKTNRLYYLYHRASSDLNRIHTFCSEPKLRDYLEGLVSRAYAEIYSIRREPWHLKIKKFYSVTFPGVFKRHLTLFLLSLSVFSIGAFFGGSAIICDPQAKEILITYSHLKGSPYERVLEEERGMPQDLEEHQIPFASYLVTHNVQVAIFTLALGFTFGIGTMILLFYNGVILGAVIADYFRYGVGSFAAGWLLPHGAFEIWAILIAGQAGFLIAWSMIKKGRYSRMTQLFLAGHDILTLLYGLGSMLFWAGIVEAFFSQYHEPLLPYGVKIAFGIIELIFLGYYLFLRPVQREMGYNGQPDFMKQPSGDSSIKEEPGMGERAYDA